MDLESGCELVSQGVMANIMLIIGSLNSQRRNRPPRPWEGYCTDTLGQTLLTTHLFMMKIRSYVLAVLRMPKLSIGTCISCS